MGRITAKLKHVLHTIWLYLPLGSGGKTHLKLVLKNRMGESWVYLVQGREKRWISLKTLMNLRVP
jgi:hypothetical protein